MKNMFSFLFRFFSKLYNSKTPFTWKVQIQEKYITQKTMLSRSKIGFVFKDRLLLLAYTVSNSLQSSGSFIISLAEELSSVIKLYPQSVLTVHLQQLTKNKKKRGTAQLRPSEDYLQIWCDFLFELVSKDSVVVTKDEVIIISEVSNEYLQVIRETKKFVEHSLSQPSVDLKQFISETLNQDKKEADTAQQNRHIAIINFSLSVTEPDKTAPKINLDCLFAGIFYQKGDKWKSYKILKGQIPSPQQIVCYDAVILTGSSFSVNNMHNNIRKLASNLVEALKISNKFRVVASCFGHQLISHTTGIKVEKRKLTKGLQTLNLEHNIIRVVPYLHELAELKSTFKLYEFHSDYVTAIPQGYKRIAGSLSCEMEMFVSEDHRVLTFQYHPEYSVEYIKWLQRRWQGLSGISADQLKQLKDDEHHHSIGIIRRAIRKLING